MSTKVVSFNYDGGSNPGSSRLVLVDNEYNGLIEGLDLNKGETRKFHTSKMKNKTEYTDIAVASADTLQADIVQMLNNKGYKTAICDSLIVGYKQVKSILTGSFTVKKGKDIVAFSSTNGHTAIAKNGTILHSGDVSLEDVIKALQSLQ